jgi:hypothetical protein
MNQDLISQDLSGGSQDMTLSGGNSTTTGFATGATCTTSGTYRASNKYMDIVEIYVTGEIFRTFVDGKKTIWYALTRNVSTNKEGSFSSVKVDAGTI